MQYLVIWSDGNKYGPADLTLLNQWAKDGRINPDTELEPVDGSPRIRASELAGLEIPGASEAPAPVDTVTAASSMPIDPHMGQESVVSPHEPAMAQSPDVSASASPSYQTPPTASPTQYFVIGPGGSKYGPADAETLVKWKAENRLNDTTQLEDSTTGQVILAGSLPGMATVQPAYQPVSPYAQQPQANPYAQAPQPAGYMNPEAGKQEVTQSFIAAAVGFFCCPIIAPSIGLWLGFKAKSLENKSAMAAIIVNFVVIGLNILGIIINLASFGAAFAGAGRTP